MVTARNGHILMKLLTCQQRCNQLNLWLPKIYKQLDAQSMQHSKRLILVGEIVSKNNVRRMLYQDKAYHEKSEYKFRRKKKGAKNEIKIATIWFRFRKNLESRFGFDDDTHCSFTRALPKNRFRKCTSLYHINVECQHVLIHIKSKGHDIVEHSLLPA